MSKPQVYAPPIAEHDSSVQSGDKNAKMSAGKHKARYPNSPLGIHQDLKGGSGGKRAFTPGTTPSGS